MRELALIGFGNPPSIQGSARLPSPCLPCRFQESSRPNLRFGTQEPNGSWRRKVPRTRLCVLVVTLLGVGAGDSGWCQSTPSLFVETITSDHHARRTVEGLAAKSFSHRRRVAAKILRDMIDTTKPVAQRQALRRAILRGLEHADAEVRLTCLRLLREVEEHEFQVELRKLASTTAAGDEIRLPFWDVYRQAVGDCDDSRRAFATMQRTNRSVLKQGFGSLGRDGGIDEFNNRLDWSGPDRHDLSGWSTLLVLDLAALRHSRDLTTRDDVDELETISGSGFGLTQRIRGDLLHVATVPHLDGSDPESYALRRLTRHWIHQRSDWLSDGDRLSLWMRCGENRQVAALSRRLIGDPRTNPQARAMAIVCWHRLGLQRAADTAALADLSGDGSLGCEDDQRWFYRGLFAGDRVVKLETRVADVALAMRLRHAGIDPRAVGFQFLRSDPIWVYQPESLGFASDSARQSAKWRATELLNIRH